MAGTGGRASAAAYPAPRRTLSYEQLRFIAAHSHAAMITVASDGRPMAVKMEAVVVDGCLESASHADKVRNRRMLRDPRCTLYFADGEYRWLSLEVDVTIVEGPDAPARLLRYFRKRDGKPSGPLDYHSDCSHHVGLGDDAFLQVMADENAVLTASKITKSYGTVDVRRLYAEANYRPIDSCSWRNRGAHIYQAQTKVKIARRFVRSHENPTD